MGQKAISLKAKNSSAGSGKQSIQWCKIFLSLLNNLDNARKVSEIPRSKKWSEISSFPLLTSFSLTPTLNVPQRSLQLCPTVLLPLDDACIIYGICDIFLPTTRLFAGLKSIGQKDNRESSGCSYYISTVK